MREITIVDGLVIAWDPDVPSRDPMSVLTEKDEIIGFAKFSAQQFADGFGIYVSGDPRFIAFNAAFILFATTVHPLDKCVEIVGEKLGNPKILQDTVLLEWLREQNLASVKPEQGDKK